MNLLKDHPIKVCWLGGCLATVVGIGLSKGLAAACFAIGLSFFVTALMATLGWVINRE